MTKVGATRRKPRTPGRDGIEGEPRVEADMTLVSGARLGSLVLGSADPERLASWYRAAFRPEAEIGKVLPLGQGDLIFEQRDDVARQAQEPGRIIINIQVDEFPVLLAHLNTLDLEWVRPAGPFPAGLIGTVKDVDGNFVNFFELSA